MNLSIIVPVYNEINQLPLFLEMLSGQESIDPELILVDGGSEDGTVELLRKFSASYRWPIRLVQADKGRARQLNTGVEQASCETLLFLHVDSTFHDKRALAAGVEALAVKIADAGHDRLAGHFRLKFTRTDDSSDFGYYFWECKARLDRNECTHGDQGFLMRRSFFNAVGPFDTDVPIAEDTRLAERVRVKGKWFLLPAEVWTSARRFEIEGLRERQTLNALIMNFAAIGWDDFFAQARTVYRHQSASEKLNMVVFFSLIDRLNRESSLTQRLATWYRTGVYVRPNAWQLAFLQDIKRNHARGIDVDAICTDNLDFHDKWFDRFTDNFIGKIIAMAGTWIWYRMTVSCFRKRANPSGQTEKHLL